MNILHASHTHVGRRANNEDALLMAPEHELFVVADGMGGYEGGEIASAIVVDAVRRFFDINAEDDDCTWPLGIDPALHFAANELRTAIVVAHREVLVKKHGRLAQMGATVVAFARDGADGVIAHIGDSRAYRLREYRLEQLTRDHSYFEMMRAAGMDEMPVGVSHIVTRAIGRDDEGPPEVTPIALRIGDRFLLCSDGVSDVLDDDAIRGHLTTPERPDPQCRRIVQAAYDAGGQDNITAIVLHVVP